MKVAFSIYDQYLIKAQQLDPAEAQAELERLWCEEEGDSSGWAWDRGEIYDWAVLRKGDHANNAE